MLPRLLAPDRPDWRWARVAELSQYSNMQAAARLQREDELTAELFAYRRELDRGDPELYPELNAAHYIHNNHPELRLLIECMLVGGASDAQVAEVAAFADRGQGVVGAYHDAFFAVRPYMDKPGWVISSVFGGPVYKTHQHDSRGIRLRVAWLLGSDAFTEFYTVGASEAQTQPKLRAMIESVLYSQATEAAFGAGSRRELPDWITAFFTKAEELKKAGGVDDYAEAVGSFLNGMSLTVADPTIDSNLQLPAREARAVEHHEVVSNA